jgi:hypothetical protein
MYNVGYIIEYPIVLIIVEDFFFCAMLDVIVTKGLHMEAHIFPNTLCFIISYAIGYAILEYPNLTNLFLTP